MLTVNEKLQGKETSTIHRFERAGLGLAPFRFTGQVSDFGSGTEVARRQKQIGQRA